MPTTTGKTSAAKAAKALLADRIALVETLGAAIDSHEKAVDAVATAQQAADTAAASVRDAFAAARAGGWSSTELTKAGFTTPASNRKTRTRKTASSDATPNGAAQPEATTAPSEQV